MERTEEMQYFVDNLSNNLYGQTIGEANKTGLCISCKKPAMQRCYSSAGRKEYRISGLCEMCFDEICGEEE